MKKINKTLIKGLALTLGVCSLIPLTACNNNDSGNKSQIWNAEKAYVEAQEQGFTGTYQEFLQSMANIRNIEINANGELVFTLGDGSVFNAGGVKGPAGNGIKSVTTEHDDENKKTIIKITFNDGTFTTVDVPDGQQGEQGEKGDKGGDGEKGDKGDTGVGIANIATTEKDRWGIVHKITYTMTDGVTYTFDIGSGVAYGRTYDANNYEELQYLIDHGVSNLILTNDIVVENAKYTLNFVASSVVNYYSLDLNGHTIYGIIQIDGDDNPVAMDLKNGFINTPEYAEIVYGKGTIYCTSAIKTFGSVALNFNDLTTYGHSFGLTTNGNSNSVELIAKNCNFYAVDNTSKTSVGGYFPAGGHYDFTNCTFEGEMGANLKSGTFEFEDCHFVGTSDYVAPIYSRRGSCGSGSALVVSSTNSYTPNLSVILKDCDLVSAHGYGLEEVALAPEGEQAGYVATITVDKNTRFEGEKGEYVSQNNVITVKDVIENPTEPTENTTVVLKETPNNEELIAYATQGKKLLVVQGEGKEYKIALCNAADMSSINMEETMANVNRVVVYTAVESNVNIVKSIEVAHSVEEIQALAKAETQTFVGVGVQLNKIPASIFDSNAYYIKKGMEYTTSTECFTFIKADVVAVSMNSASVSYQGQTMYVTLTNTTEGMANVQIDTELEGLSIQKMVLTEQDGYIASITEETFATGATMSAGETVVLRISLSGEFTTEKPISFIFSNGLM